MNLIPAKSILIHFISPGLKYLNVLKAGPTMNLPQTELHIWIAKAKIAVLLRFWIKLNFDKELTNVRFHQQLEWRKVTWCKPYINWLQTFYNFTEKNRKTGLETRGLDPGRDEGLIQKYTARSQILYVLHNM